MNDESLANWISGMLTLGYGLDSIGVLFSTSIQYLASVLLFRIMIGIIIYIGSKKACEWFEQMIK